MKRFAAWTSAVGNPGWRKAKLAAASRLARSARLAARLAFELGFGESLTSVEPLRKELLESIARARQLEDEAHLFLVAHASRIDLPAPSNDTTDPKELMEFAEALQRLANQFSRGEAAQRTASRLELLKCAEDRGIPARRLARAIVDFGFIRAALAIRKPKDGETHVPIPIGDFPPRRNDRTEDGAVLCPVTKGEPLYRSDAEFHKATKRWKNDQTRLVYDDLRGK